MQRLAAAILLLGIATTLPGCSDGNNTDTPAITSSSMASIEVGDNIPDALADVDLLVRMAPGARVGAQAEVEQLVVALGDVVPGTEDPIASVSTPFGVANISTYQVVLRDPGAPDAPMFCVVLDLTQNGDVGCHEGRITEPQLGDVSIGESPSWASAYGGEDAQFAIVVTDKGARIGIVTVRGWVLAEWESSLGDFDAITFYDADGNPGFESSYN